MRELDNCCGTTCDKIALGNEIHQMAEKLIAVNEFCQSRNIGKVGDSAVDSLMTAYDALAAQVEAVKRELCSLSDWFSAYWPDLTLEQKERLKQADKIAKATPQHHLRELKAQHERSGFITGAEQFADPDKVNLASIAAAADLHADSIRRGEV